MIHYGVPGRRAACGMRVRRVTKVRSRVECALCRRTLKFRMQWFSHD